MAADKKPEPTSRRGREAGPARANGRLATATCDLPTDAARARTHAARATAMVGGLPPLQRTTNAAAPATGLRARRSGLGGFAAESRGRPGQHTGQSTAAAPATAAHWGSFRGPRGGQRAGGGVSSPASKCRAGWVGGGGGPMGLQGVALGHQLLGTPCVCWREPRMTWFNSEVVPTHRACRGHTVAATAPRPAGTHVAPVATWRPHDVPGGLPSCPNAF